MLSASSSHGQITIHIQTQPGFRCHIWVSFSHDTNFGMTSVRHSTHHHYIHPLFPPLTDIDRESCIESRFSCHEHPVPLISLASVAKPTFVLRKFTHQLYLITSRLSIVARTIETRNPVEYAAADSMSDRPVPSATRGRKFLTANIRSG